MKSTDIVCSVCKRGSFVIPSQFRSILNIKSKDILEIKTEDRKVILKKHEFVTDSLQEGYWYNPVGSRGRITIPKPIRIELSIKDIDRVLVHLEDEVLVLKK
ncbi:AbrB/MazE/SpoVT family DNA-binding domain-containing protein [Priestia megaterium]|jgi:AbrB family looped-hinge helix DNA binding protein|uniref:AbrB/MazE/SpoVT family DNA-binding domain-containing protein n=1 Tax=Priestia megaterium TaxID=1404 RepID=UPI001C22387E|nr:AbrB/MazE/SpoVT family DNA-binding domain-containing protein [Priestia megaterium]MBU8590013.1 AbrB/MazE/SpoVT family DNA-binding domain-containing protein [Priestia megaterium]MDF2016387.1 AbrB/MazE/SpoVT family DNA-binding domain-containing protein [Priestia megaterium]MDF2052715.1 AbrB/MazE/SpoVT family DNA-binding domain-containing protein [Priestia megaterium]MDF2058837.1 AbrB/MazE/SpoVT family DNA-binding domain-containing protein [Priestia megaterium]MDP1383470.1 AbrB/MazE/SpoVT fami